MVVKKTLRNSQANGRLLAAARNTPEDVLQEYRISYDGLDEEAVEAMRAEYGKNVISHKKRDSIFKKLAAAFINPFTLVLLVLAAVSYFTDVIMAAPGGRNYTAVIIVGTMVFISGSLSFIQEAKSSKAAEKLRGMVKTKIDVRRNPEGRLEVLIEELVVGDIIYLAAGDMIPADVRILQSKDLFIGQASLTGESEPVEKLSNKDESDSKNPLDYNNLAFMGSNVISGSAVAVVIAVGDDTAFGSIAKKLSAKAVPNSFDKGVNAISWLIIRFILVMVPVILLINGYTKGNWMEAFLFALSVAVGLTPEMLPMIVSTNLAKGAVAMSRKKVIVKNLNSIQNFGAMDVLCTDKTGTITQDKIVLQYHLDIHGNDDVRVLRHAFLNSYFQTGLKNLMDVSIIERALEEGMEDLKTTYRKVDEIPFDFNRRRMSVVIEDKKGKTQMVTKGAIEEMLNISSFVEYKGKVLKMTKELKKEILETCKSYNDDGMRILGVAQKTEPSDVGVLSVADEKDMVLIGYLAFLDPPKAGAHEAIKTLHDYGVAVKVLTGDNGSVTKTVCKQVGLKSEKIILGADIEKMDDRKLKEVVEKHNIFAKLSPEQKARIVAMLRSNGHVVGFMGDGINDSVAMKAADVGISVDTAVDIAKESANIILLEKNLMVLEEGVIEGRKTYANTIKYIKMTASANFGNMFSVVVASAFLPFLPMLPLQILILNLSYDISCISIPWDNVDAEYLKKPRKWDASSVGRFMVRLGPTSSVFDITTYLLMFFGLCPYVIGEPYHLLGTEAKTAFAALFHTGWFVESLWTQTLVIHIIRTKKIPFIQSRASWQVTGLTSLAILFGTVVPYTGLGERLGLQLLPWFYYPALLLTILCYMLLVVWCKYRFVKKYGELL